MTMIVQQMTTKIMIKAVIVRLKIPKKMIKIYKLIRNLVANITFENATKDVQNAKNSSLVDCVMI